MKFLLLLSVLFFYWTSCGIKGATCPANCIKCGERAQCLRCNNETFLFDQTCVESCPYRYYPHFNQQHNLFECQMIRDPLLLNNTLNFMKDYEVLDFIKEGSKTYVIEIPETLQGLSVCMWVYYDPPNNVSEYPLCLMTRYSGHKAFNNERTLFYISARGSNLDVQLHPNTVSQNIQQKRWNEVCFYFVNSLAQLTVNSWWPTAHLLEQIQVGYYFLHVGGFLNSNKFPGKVTSLSLTAEKFIPELDWLRLPLMADGIKRLISLYTFDQYSDKEHAVLILLKIPTETRVFN